LPKAQVLEASWFNATVFLNRGNSFAAEPLPDAAQFAPSFGVTVGDFDGDGHEDIFLSQNFLGVNPDDTRFDAGRGLWLRGDGAGQFAPVPGQESGVILYGEQRGCALSDFDQDGRIDLAVAQNNWQHGLFRNIGGRPGLRVHLRGPRENPAGIGAVLRLQYASDSGPATSVQAGSGYWSQDSVLQVLGVSAVPRQILVRWPGGKLTTHPVPPGAREVTISAEPPDPH
jgi:enediyne biosynthesis protein E4